MQVEFSAPASLEGFKKADAEGHRLVLIGMSFGEGETVHGAAQWADVRYVIDVDARRVFFDVRLFGRRLVPVLAGSIGPVVVGRLITGVHHADGINPPWLLEALAPEDQLLIQDLLAPYVTTPPGGGVSVNVSGIRAEGFR